MKKVDQRKRLENNFEAAGGKVELMQFDGFEGEQFTTKAELRRAWDRSRRGTPMTSNGVTTRDGLNISRVNSPVILKKPTIPARVQHLMDEIER